MPEGGLPGEGGPSSSPYYRPVRGTHCGRRILCTGITVEARVTFFPNTSIRGDTFRQSAPELYASTLQAFGHLATSNPSLAVSESKFRNGCAVYAQSFERSNVLDLAGQPSSNSRIVNLMTRFQDTLTRDSEFYLFYVQLIRCFSSNCVVEQ